MKSMFLAAVLLCAFLLLARQAGARSLPDDRLPRWVPTKGYWVVEDNINHPGKAVVYFYNRQNVLVYQETVTCRINLDRRRTLLRLNRVLEHAVAGWERQAPVALETGLLAQQMAH
ncbi:MAG: hypothetical protein EOO12_13920 [Chitinophagaceae bacterium]|nr:MAG: hypothetical protein EOO12_13920 [Chitinophagaceae bacterium]